MCWKYLKLPEQIPRFGKLMISTRVECIQVKRAVIDEALGDILTDQQLANSPSPRLSALPFIGGYNNLSRLLLTG